MMNDESKKDKRQKIKVKSTHAGKIIHPAGYEIMMNDE
jgi:hypothetical protein